MSRPASRSAPSPPAVFLDMDDTVFDHANTCRAALGRVRRTTAFLRRTSLDELFRFYSQALEAAHPEILRGRLTADRARELRWRAVVDRFGGGTSVDARALVREYRAAYEARQRAVPGARTLLRRLHRRARVAIVTNNELAEQERKLDVLGVRPWVDQLVVSSEVGAAKPDPRIFETALARCGVRAADTVMLGDSWENDVLGARGAGIRPVWFNRFHRPRPPGADVEEVDTLRPPQQVEALLLRSAPGRRVPARIISRGPLETR